MENKLRERVLRYCEHMNIRISQFEKRSGLSNGYFNQVSKKPSDSKLESISAAHPELNIDWLCTGHGEMLNEQVNDSSVQSDTPVANTPVADNSLVSYLERKVSDQDLLIRELYQQIGALEKEIELARKGETAGFASGFSDANVG